jgi:hypothetical protein
MANGVAGMWSEIHKLRFAISGDLHLIFRREGAARWRRFFRVLQHPNDFAAEAEFLKLRCKAGREAFRSASCRRRRRLSSSPSDIAAKPLGETEHRQPAGKTVPRQNAKREELMQTGG